MAMLLMMRNESSGFVVLPFPCSEMRKVIAALAIAAPAEQISRSNLKQIATKLHGGSKAITKEIEILVN